ncbi:hypothetical protein MANAM107_19610 [Actinomyces capricornis]|uniref:Uncharacterized protein n=1 Tax=Actinomyces capricornis TaxID=2755559 RepID=A0ABM7UD70_9ACTO|nr:hypothetical protein MANAM107_19610 [Actinomyces capricornis]
MLLCFGAHCPALLRQAGRCILSVGCSAEPQFYYQTSDVRQQIDSTRAVAPSRQPVAPGRWCTAPAPRATRRPAPGAELVSAAPCGADSGQDTVVPTSMNATPGKLTG